MSAFCLLAIGFFTAYSNFGIPQIVPEPPPEDEELDLGSMTMDEFVAVGERLFTGKGTCTLCHNELGRAPMLDNAVMNAEARLADAKYEGSARSSQGYLRESLIEPSAYVVQGFGVVGTNDTESPMPSVTGAGIAMSETEILAVIAYLQDLAAAQITVTIPDDVEAPVEPALTPTAALSGGRSLYASAEEIITGLGCGACHKVAEHQGAIGPDLTHIGALRGVDHLRRSILDPNADVEEGYLPNMMPPTYGDQLFAAELEMLVGYMAALE